MERSSLLIPCRIFGLGQRAPGLALDDAGYQKLLTTLTPARIKAHFGDWVRGEVDVFPMPNINGFNLLLHNALGGGATKTLRYDVTGKAFSTAILRMEVAD